jgi:transcriptional regulator with XRE-family HTH domain
MSTEKAKWPGPVAQRIETRRKELGMSRQAVGRETGMPGRQVRRIEKGEITLTADHVRCFAAALNTTIGALYGEPHDIARTEES